MPPPDEFDELIAQAKNKVSEGAQKTGDEFDDLIAKSRAKMEETLPYGNEPAPEQPWYESAWDAYTNSPTDAQRAEAIKMMHRNPEAEVSPTSTTGMLGHAVGTAVGLTPGTGPLARVGLGALGGAISRGTDAYGSGASLIDTAKEAGQGALWGGGLTGAFEAAGPLLKRAGVSAKNAANEKLATIALPANELNRARVAGDAAVVQEGQRLRNAGVASPRGRDRFRPATPTVMSRNVAREMSAARAAGVNAEDAILNTPAGGQLVGETNVDVFPVKHRMTGAAARLRYEKASPEGPAAYEEVRDRFTTPSRPKGPPERFPQPGPDVVGDVGLAPPTEGAGQGELIFPQPTPYPRTPMPTEQGSLPFERGVRAGVQQGLPLGAPEPLPRFAREAEQVPLDLPPATPEQQDFGFDSPPRQMSLATDATAPRARPESFGSTDGPQMGLDFAAPEGQLSFPREAPNAAAPAPDTGTPPIYPERPPMEQAELPLPGQQSLRFSPSDNLLASLSSSPSSADSQLPLEFNAKKRAGAQLPLEFNRNEQQLELPLEGQQGIAFPPTEPSSPPRGPIGSPNQTELDFNRPNQTPVQAPLSYEPPAGTQTELPLPGQQSLPFPPRAQTPSSDENLLSSPVSNEQLPMYYGGYNPPGTALSPQPAPPTTPLPTPPEQLSLPLEEHPRTGYTLRELIDSTRRAGKEASPSFHGGSKLNKAPTYQTEAQSEVYHAGKELSDNELDKAVGNGYVNLEDRAARSAANTKFAKLATVAPNLAKQANQANRAALKPGASNRNILGVGLSYLGDAKNAAVGVNSQYVLGQGLEGAGTAAKAGSDLARAGAGLGWVKDDNKHPEVAKAAAENPGAPKAAIEQKANANMKESIFDTWYNKLQSLVQ